MKNLLIGILISLAYLNCLAQNKVATVSLIIDGQEKRGILSEGGQLLIPIQYKYIVADSNIYIVSKDGLWGCLNEKAEEIVPVKYQDIGVRRSEAMIRVKKNDKWGYVNLKDSTIIDFVYDFACNFKEGKAYVRKDGLNFFIDPQGNKLSASKRNLEYCPEDIDTASAIRNQFEDNILLVKEDKGKYGVVNKTKKAIIPVIFDEIGLYYNGVILVRRGKLWGAYTDKGKLITKPAYDDIGIFWEKK